GTGTARGDYAARKEAEAAMMVQTASQSFAVSFPGIVYTAQDACRAIDLFVTEKVDCVLALYLSWAEDFAFNRFLRDMPPVPILFAYRMRDSVSLGDTHDEDEFTEYLCCGGLVGSLEASGDVARYGRDMLSIVSGTWPEVLARLSSFANAARARALLREGRLGLLASYNEVMWSTYVDPYRVFMEVGPEINFLSIAELCDQIEAVTPEEAQAVMARLKEKYCVLPDVEEDKFFASVRATMGMERQAAAHGADLLVLNDVDTVLFEKVGLRPGFYPTEESVKTVVVPEGDVGAGLAAYMLKLLTGEHLHFIEPFHIDLPSDTFEGGHAGPNDYTAPGGVTRIARDVRFAKTGYRYAGAPFAWHVFPQGRHTMVHLSQHRDGFVMTVNLVDSLPQTPHLATYSHGRFRPVGMSCRELFDKLLRIGVTQHYVLVAGDHSQEILDLGALLGFECHRL
ncbi:MAG: hypothetical protein PHY12_14655, partial [Eubacteriales bacterium]|nr:hypothetical protein [Eubacteriales bacterium]